MDGGKTAPIKRTWIRGTKMLGYISRDEVKRAKRQERRGQTERKEGGFDRVIRGIRLEREGESLTSL